MLFTILTNESGFSVYGYRILYTKHGFGFEIRLNDGVWQHLGNLAPNKESLLPLLKKFQDYQQRRYPEGNDVLDLRKEDLNF